MLLKLSEVNWEKKTSPLRGIAETPTPTDLPIVTSNEVRNEMKLYEEALSCAQEAEEELWTIFFLLRKKWIKGRGFTPDCG